MLLSLKSKWLITKCMLTAETRTSANTLGEIKQSLRIYKSHGQQQAVNSITIWSKWTGSRKDANLIILWIGHITRNVSESDRSLPYHFEAKKLSNICPVFGRSPLRISPVFFIHFLFSSRHRLYQYSILLCRTFSRTFANQTKFPIAK